MLPPAIAVQFAFLCRLAAAWNTPMPQHLIARKSFVSRLRRRPPLAAICFALGTVAPGFVAPRLVAIAFLALGYATPSHGAAAEPQRVFKAGAAAVEVTPRTFPVSMTGSFWDRKATSAHDTLHARSLVLDDGAVRVAIVVVDSCLMSREIYDEAKRRAAEKTGMPVSRMFMSATHTHTAPTAVALAQCHPDPQYVAYLTRRISLAVEEANAHLEPAEIGWAVAQVPSEVFNRRWKMKPGAIRANPFGGIDQVKMNPPRGSADLLEPAGPTDPDVTILSLRTTQGKPLALLANYALHYVGGIPTGQVSADYFGEFARQIEQRIGAGGKAPRMVGILSNGASGDINNINFRKPRPGSEPFERVKAVASKVADAAHSAYRTIKHRPWVSLAMQEREIELGVRRPDAAALKYAKKVLANVKGPTLATLPEVYARETEILSESPARVSVKLQALRVGEAGFVSIPCEAFTEIGLHLKQHSPLRPTIVAGLANGYNGYLPTPRQHKAAGYETWRSRWSYLEVNASKKISNVLLELLEEVVEK